jgi:hypothetical protein
VLVREREEVHISVQRSPGRRRWSPSPALKANANRSDPGSGAATDRCSPIADDLLKLVKPLLAGLGLVAAAGTFLNALAAFDA